MCNCYHPHLTYTPPAPAMLAMGSEALLVLVRYTGEQVKSQFGHETGQYYPFSEHPQRYVDARDLPYLKGVTIVLPGV